MTGERKTLDFGGLDDFAPKARAVPDRQEATARDAVDRVSEFPSREKFVEGQLNIRAPDAVLDRFKAMAKKDRYTYGAFLEILLNAYKQD